MTRSLKYQITEAVLKQLPYETTSVESLIREWWVTKTGFGLRLTAVGERRFNEAQIEYYDCIITIPHDKWPSFMNECSKKLKCPYFFGIRKQGAMSKPESYVRLYDSKIAMMLTLYGDIQSYLESVKVRR